MLPIRLEIKNFLAYRSPEPLRFDGIHLACLTGANGAGKSSLLDAITWALWGKARARRDEELVHMGQNDMYVLLEFEQEGLTLSGDPAALAPARAARHARPVRAGRGRHAQRHQRAEHARHAGEDQPPAQPRLRDLRPFGIFAAGQSRRLHHQDPARAQANSLGHPRLGALGRLRGSRQRRSIKRIDAEISVRRCRSRKSSAKSRRSRRFRPPLAEAEQQQQEAEAALHVAEDALKQVEHAPAEMRAALRADRRKSSSACAASRAI